MKVNNEKIELNEGLQLENNLNAFNNDYKYFVCDIYDGLQILSGWEYKEDALDDLGDTEETADYCNYNCELKVYTRRYLETLIK